MSLISRIEGVPESIRIPRLKLQFYLIIRGEVVDELLSNRIKPRLAASIYSKTDVVVSNTLSIRPLISSCVRNQI